MLLIAALVISSEMLLLVMIFSTCSKNSSYFWVNSFVNVGFGRTVTGVVGDLNFQGIVLYRKI